MAPTQAGIHHTTGITGDAQANVDFYADLLGLRLVKRTVNHNDKAALHLFYGDSEGAPGTLLSFFVWPDTAFGRRGAGQATEIGLRVPQESFGAWVQRLLRRDVAFSGPKPWGTGSALFLEDPDGLPIVLVGVADGGVVPWPDSTVPDEMQVQGIHHVTFWTEQPEETGKVLEQHLGFRRDGEIEGTWRFRSPAPLGNTVLVRDTSGFWPSAGGVGSLHHVAFRAQNSDHERAILAAAEHDGLEVSEVREHGYFQSIYFREPGGSLLEVATDGPGFTLDEDTEELGRSLLLPPAWERERADIEVVLPYFALPGEPRRPTRDMGWIHRFVPGTSQQTLLLLHGSGGNETSLLAFGRRAAPEANLLSVRGRSLEEGHPRFFKRFDAFTYDQQDLRGEAEALAQFTGEAADFYGFDRQHLVALGHSNGANIALASLALAPGAFGGVVLLRPVMVFEDPPEVDLGRMSTLVLLGLRDPYLARGEAVGSYLERSGSKVREETLDTGHELGDQDEAIVTQWLLEWTEGDLGS